MIEFIIELFFAIFWWVILFPTVLVLATPYVLISASFDELSYKHSVIKKYQNVKKLWIDWGLVIVP